MAKTMTITLDEDKFNKKTSKAMIQESLTQGLAATKSGRLSEILSLSHPEDLNSSYIIDSVTPSAWGGRTVVHEGGMDFHRKRADDLECKKVSLTQKLGRVHEELQMLVEWQIANLVLHAFAQFAWDYVSIPDKAELVTNNMFNFLDLFYGRFGHMPARRNLAMQIFAKLPATLHAFMNDILSKQNVSFDRKQLAHPEIPQDHLEIFLRSLGYGNLNGPLDIAVFEHLKTNSISKENVERAARR